MEMLEENLRIAAEAEVGEIDEAQRELYADAVKAINESVKVGCTGCGYCQPCPKGVDIPGTFAAYNRWHGENKRGAFMDYLKCTTFRKNASCASNCVQCGKCEAHCPQGIEIRKELKEAGVITVNLLQQSKLNLEGADTEKMQKIDIRTFSDELVIDSKKPKILTHMPEQSYSMVVSGKQTRLFIKDPALFWSMSKILVIQK